ncbi:Uma2 family endonuclease [Streptomyces bambusae]|uniref:Uma2 family endonuclease n=1 Tax=Streptomyces bambusae TaxID=1550616 RepID=A0ABS6ZB63_9ACTN|nr:Uma2 family endonuclease [Streptomyces bambusae]MBW5484473.1 Uma2 family endonuclease [Streptomyces bambusae]
MSVMTGRPHMLTEEFETLARIGAREVEGLRLEFIDGKLGVKAVPDGDHDRIVVWLSRICMQHVPDLWLHVERGLRVEHYRSGRARPDASLAPDGAFEGQGEWADPAPVLMVVEVTSYDSDTDERDRREKPRAYAETGIPIYLLIDRDKGLVTVHSEPDGQRYDSVRFAAFGKDVELPEPLGFSFPTEALKDWVR